ncbi:MAG: hypothetical protein QXU64_04450 [Thermofilaceae archaeon]
MGSIKYVDELKLDFEQRHPYKRLSIPRIKFVAKMLRLRVRDVVAHRTANGVHVRIALEQRLHPIAAVLVQALMGSDYARETYNAIRAFNLTASPDKYDDVVHECWNVLFHEKYVGGRLASREVFDPRLTRRLRRALEELMVRGEEGGGEG